MSAEKPSVRIGLDLTTFEDYFKQDTWSDWRNTLLQHEPQGQTSEGMAVHRFLLFSNNA